MKDRKDLFVMTFELTDESWLKYEYDAANRLQMIRNDADNAPLELFQYGSSNQRLPDYDYLNGQF